MILKCNYVLQLPFEQLLGSYANDMTKKLKPFSTNYSETKGRLHPEASSSTRTPFQRDRDRIIHSAAFRRLMHKTQVFISPEGDHFRTRLTHSLEVAQIARTMARSLQVDEDLCEAVALAHDLGHTPFGHSGEELLDKLMADFDGFDHNDQALRVLVQLENRYIGFKGLNLSWETLEGVVKHNGPLIGGTHVADSLPITIKAYNKLHNLELETFAGIEAQIAAISDDIAYNHHDMDDGLRAGLFTIEQVSNEVAHVGDIFNEVRNQHPDIHPHVLVSEAVRRLIGDMVGDVMKETKARLKTDNPNSAEDVRKNTRSLVAFSPEMAEKERALKSFLFANMYRAPSVYKEREKADKIMSQLFRHFMQKPNDLPGDWRRLCKGPNSAKTARVVADYIAGMTDRFAAKSVNKIEEQS